MSEPLVDHGQLALDTGQPARPASPAVARLVDDLNPSQRAAVEHRGGPLLIVAGAGSGKTRVLTRRIAHLLATGDAQPGQILAITFTNKAAGEMKERVGELVGARARAMWVSTFHSACVRILRSESSRLDVSSSFTIYDQADSLRLMTMVIRDLEPGPEEVHAAVVPRPGVEPEERAHRPRDVRQPHRERHGAASSRRRTASTSGACAGPTPSTSTT